MNKETKFLIDNLTKNLVLLVMEDFNYSITEAMDAASPASFLSSPTKTLPSTT